ncbi:M48 family metallopeptidase [Microbacterium sp. NPDC057944]|uniref:M48 family metallopeptidase n=1 Tax=Microbacterium sp. NPDC057944 TaxID=3346286 RepID=UPI0036DA5A1B
MNAQHTVDYGDARIDYEVTHTNRDTLDIAVAPNGVITVRAPMNAKPDQIADRVRQRGRWILTQRRYFDQFRPRTTDRRWVPGETHLYRGRQYRLRIGEPERLPQRIRLIGGFLLLDGVDFSDSVTIERMMLAWYRERAHDVFTRQLPGCMARFGDRAISPTSVQLRTMRTHWGSMSANGRLSLNPGLVRAPTEAIDYVITHELAHLVVPHHGREFWELMTSVLPDHAERKARLERALM